jgi:putative nucleotidyltransferase with HDIG domain
LRRRPRSDSIATVCYFIPNMQKPTKNIALPSFSQKDKGDLLLRLALAERKLSLTSHKLEARNRELAAVYRLSETIGSERHTSRLSEQTALEISRTLGVETVCVLLRDEHAGSLISAAWIGVPKNARGRVRVKAGDGLLWQVMKTGKPLLISGDGAQKLSGGKRAGLLAVPIKTKGKTFGVIYVCGKLNGKEFSARERDMLSGIANQAAVALDNAALHHDYENLLVGIAWSFAAALDAKSPWTAGHSKRVTQYAVTIAEELKQGDEFVHTVQTCGLLHDIGKIGIPEALLDKPDTITREERRTVCEHATLGASILQHIDTFQPVIPGVRHHHERWDGGGFPDGLAGGQIPLLARVLAVADAFDAITSDRPYRPRRGRAEAFEEIKRCSGSHFDPLVVEAFVDACGNDVFRALP